MRDSMRYVPGGGRLSDRAWSPSAASSISLFNTAAGRRFRGNTSITCFNLITQHWCHLSDCRCSLYVRSSHSTLMSLCNSIGVLFVCHCYISGSKRPTMLQIKYRTGNCKGPNLTLSMWAGDSWGPTRPDDTKNWDITPKQCDSPHHVQASDERQPRLPSLNCKTTKESCTY